MKRLTPSTIRSFRRKVYDHYRKQGRDLPWRKTDDPYHILVSEIMLQQTQVERVTGKYREFLRAFPNLASLARAPLARLLRIWSGMGYNRRALSLKRLAQQVVAGHQGKLPADPAELIKLPGIGPYTAGAVAAFAFNKPVVVMDTNIRRVFIHEFFQDKKGVRDVDILPLVEETLDRKHAGRWYNALMDFGAMLKSKEGNPNRRSAHYTRQSPFENSNRQVRGRILKALVGGEPLTGPQITKAVGMDREQVKKNLAQLGKEGFIKKVGRTFVII